MSRRAFMAYDIANQIADADGITAGKVFEKEVSLTSTQIRAMNGTPIELVAAPGPGKIIEFVSAVLFLDHDGGSNYAGGDGIVVRSSSTTHIVVSGSLASSNSINLGHDNYAMIEALNAAVMLAADVDEALELYAGADHTTGTSTARIKITYRILDFN